MSRDLLSGSLGADKLTARFQETLSPKALIDLRTQKPSAAPLNPDLIASIEHELREAVVIFEKEKQRLTGEIQRLNEVVKSQEGRYAEMGTKYASEKRQSDRKVEELLQRIDDLETGRQDEEAKALGKQLAQAQARAKALEASNGELTASNASLLEQNRALTAQLSKLQSQLAVSSEEQFLLLSNYRKVQQNLHEKVQSEADLRLQNSTLSSENDKLARTLATERERTSQRLSQLEGELRAVRENKAEQTLASTVAPTLDLSGAFNLTNFEEQMKDNSRRIQRLEQQLHETSSQHQALKTTVGVETSFYEEKPHLKNSSSSRSLTPVRSHSRSQDQRSKQKPVSPKPVKSARPTRHSQKLSWKQPH